jgi:hypothetical protein
MNCGAAAQVKKFAGLGQLYFRPRGTRWIEIDFACERRQEKVLVHRNSANRVRVLRTVYLALEKARFSTRLSTLVLKTLRK